MSDVDELGRLSDLHKSGELSNAEFAEEKAKVLGTHTTLQPDRKIKKHHVGLGVLGCLGLWFVFAVAGHNSGDRSNSTPPDPREDVYVGAQIAVEHYLKAPSTADFAYMGDAKITSNTDGIYTVISYVDSQNGFGAKIRTYFTINMRKNGNDWIADSPPQFSDN